MKRVSILLLAAALTATLLAGCNTAASTPAPTAAPTATAAPVPTEAPAPTEDPAAVPDNGLGTPDAELSATLDAIYAIKAPGIPVDTREVNLADAAWLTYYTGLTDAAGVEAAIASEAQIGSQAYSVVLLRTAPDADAAALAQSVLDGVNPVKWVCVQADDIRAVASGNLVMLAMMDSALSDVVTSAELVDAFVQTTGAAPDFDATRTLEPFDADAAPGPV